MATARLILFSMFYSLRIFLYNSPLNIILWKLKCKIFGTKIPELETWFSLFYNKQGIEIGGPSGLFNKKGYLPIYPAIKLLDGVNFSTSTVWEGKLSEGYFYKFHDKTGYQFISEGTHLPKIPNSKYEFVLSCNNLEHIANPIAALLEWKRIINKAGLILLVLPNKMANFDHERPYTTIEHLIQDFNEKITENDKTHLDEVLKHHDLKRDALAGKKEQFIQRCFNNIENRCMHHHVFNQTLLKQVFDYCKMETILQYTSPTDHYIVARKS